MASPAAALSLGAIHVQSHLGEPLRAEIDITQITAAEAGSLQATLASRQCLQAHGTELSPTARNVRVELDLTGQRRFKIRLTTTSPVNDPFIDLILQANWSAGNLTRGYTLLLDPPPRKTPRTHHRRTSLHTSPNRANLPLTTAHRSAQRLQRRSSNGDNRCHQRDRAHGGHRRAHCRRPRYHRYLAGPMLVAMLRNNPSAFIQRQHQPH